VRYLRIFNWQRAERDRVNDLARTKATELRIGDVLLLQTGDIVPADAKLLEASGLEIDELAL